MIKIVRRILVSALALGSGHAAGAAAAQTRDTTVVPNPAFAASELEEWMYGQDHRHLWTTPLRVPVLDLGSIGGGLTPTRRGGGLQTKSLRFMGADGREYVFRSLRKYPDLAREPALRDTYIGHVVQDQTSSLHPGAPAVVAPLMEAVEILHPSPRLYVMPDVPALGEFRSDFAGMLGWVEERPDDAEGDRPGFGGFRRIVSTENLLEKLEDDPDDQLNAREYLIARLMDMLLGDWDRHEDQWRWAAVEQGKTRIWRPIPRDRDYAFVNYDGLFMRVGRTFVPNAVEFEPRITNVYGLTLNARALDRRLLSELSWEEWQEAVRFVESRITDALIDRAVLRMPRELQPLAAAELASRLKSRRNSLPQAAKAFYSLLSSDVDVHATDKRDVALVDRAADGSVLVRLYDADREGQPQGEPYFQRRFVRDETNEVRVYLHGGDDRAVVRGTAEHSLTTRLIGGGGDDVLADSSRIDEGKTAFYDHRGDNRFVRGSNTVVDTREFEEPEAVRGLSGESYRNWGRDLATVPVLGYKGEDGVIVGGGVTHTRFGFRKIPFARSITGRAMIGTRTGAVAGDLVAIVRRQNSNDQWYGRLLGSQLESIRFYGFGNDTEADQPSDFYVVRQNELRAEGSYVFGLPSRTSFAIGPVVKLFRTQLPAGTPFAREHEGGSSLGHAGAQAEFRLDQRDDLMFPTKGTRAEIGGSAFPTTWGASGRFAEMHALGVAYWTPDTPLQATLALRAGGKRVWGDFPIQEAAFLGGSRTIRGYPYQRFAGDGMVFGNAELRVPVTQAKLLVRGDLGVLALADAGRVFYQGDSSDALHTAFGGGLWFRVQVRNTPLATSLTYAHGDVGRVYLKIGAPF